MTDLPGGAGDDPWEASDGTRWLHFPQFAEWHGWQPGEGGLWVLTEADFRQSYPEHKGGDGRDG